jgi:hypothetical protein
MDRITTTETALGREISIRPGRIPWRVWNRALSILVPIALLAILTYRPWGLDSLPIRFNLHWLYFLGALVALQSLPAHLQLVRGLARERLLIGANDLTLERRVLGFASRRSVAVADVLAIHVVDRFPFPALHAQFHIGMGGPGAEVEILLRGQDPLRICRGMNHERRTLEGLAASIEQARAGARKAGQEISERHPPRQLPSRT